MKINLNKRNEKKINDILESIQPDIEEGKRIRFSDLKPAIEECAEIALTTTLFPSPLPIKIGIQAAISKASNLLYSNRYAETDQHLIASLEWSKKSWNIVELKRAACDFKHIITIERDGETREYRL